MVTWRLPAIKTCLNPTIEFPYSENLLLSIIQSVILELVKQSNRDVISWASYSCTVFVPDLVFGRRFLSKIHKLDDIRVSTNFVIVDSAVADSNLAADLHWLCSWNRWTPVANEDETNLIIVTWGGALLIFIDPCPTSVRQVHAPILT